MKTAPKPADTTVAVTQDVLRRIEAHVARSLEHELGGFLLGNRYRCPNSGIEYVMIDQCSPAESAEGTAVSLAITEESWGRLFEELNGKFLGKLLVGWYHSHPRMDIFLSAWDIPIHESRFPDAWATALVLEPEKGFGGFFARRDGVLDDQIPIEFFEYLEGDAVATRESSMRWKGYECYHAQEGAPTAPPVARTEIASVPAPAVLAPPEKKIPADTGTAPEIEPNTAPFPSGKSIYWVARRLKKDSPEQRTLLFSGSLLALLGAPESHERGGDRYGLLLGMRRTCPNTGKRYCLIDRVLPASEAGGLLEIPNVKTQQWAELEQRVASEFGGRIAAGWYRCQANGDLLMTQGERAFHIACFPRPWMPALLIDTKKAQAALLSIAGNHDAAPSSFYEYQDYAKSGASSGLAWPGCEPQDAATGARISRPALRKAQGSSARRWFLANPWLQAVGFVLCGAVLGAGTLAVFNRLRPESAGSAAVNPSPRINVERVALAGPNSADKGLSLRILLAGLPSGVKGIKVTVEGTAAEVHELQPDQNIRRFEATVNSPDIRQRLHLLDDPTAQISFSIAVADIQKPAVPLQQMIYALTGSSLKHASAGADVSAAAAVRDEAGWKAVADQASKLAVQLRKCAKSAEACNLANATAVQRFRVDLKTRGRIYKQLDQFADAVNTEPSETSIRKLAAELDEIAKRLKAGD